MKTNNEKVTIDDYYYYYLLKCEDTLNELEKDIENKITFCNNEANGSINNNLCKISIQYLRHLRDKIKEIKGKK